MLLLWALLLWVLFFCTEPRCDCDSQQFADAAFAFGKISLAMAEFPIGKRDGHLDESASHTVNAPEQVFLKSIAL